MGMLHNLASRTLKTRGMQVFHSLQIPFGFDWTLDMKYLSSTQPVQLVLDIGANIGQTALAVNSVFPDATIHCFEPVHATFTKLTAATAHLPQVQRHRLALAETSGKLAMTATPGSGTNRLLPGDALSGTEIVEVSTVDDFCNHLGLQEISLLKMDVEGAEHRVLRGAEQTLRKRSVRFILSECDFIRREMEPHASFEELHVYLSSFGFHVVSFYTAGVDAEGWRWGNVLFMKPIGSRDDGFATSPLGGQIKTRVGRQ